MNIRKLRKKSKISMEKLARKAETSVRTIWCLEHGRNLPTVNTLLKIAKALNVPVSKIFEDIDQEKHTTPVG